MPDTPRLTTVRDGRVLIVTFNNPPRHYFDERMSIELDDLTRALERDRTVGAVVFTGTDDVYMTGFHVPDLARGARLSPVPVPYPAARIASAASRWAARPRALDRALRVTPLRDMLLMSRVYGALERLNRMDKVVVTAINGLALGMGCVFALACDLRVMADDKEIGMPESAIAMLAAGGGTQRLVRLVGTARALELLLDGRWLRASEAADLGLVHRVVPPEQVRPRALAWAHRLAERSPLVTREIKRLVYDAGTRPWDSGIRREAVGLVTTTSAAEAGRNLDRYLELQAAQEDSSDDTVKNTWRSFLADGRETTKGML